MVGPNTPLNITRPCCGRLKAPHVLERPSDTLLFASLNLSLQGSEGGHKNGFFCNVSLGAFPLALLLSIDVFLDHGGLAGSNAGQRQEVSQGKHYQQCGWTAVKYV